MKHLEKFFNLAGDYPLSKRLKFFLNEKGITDKYIEDSTTDESGKGSLLPTIKKIRSGKYDDKYMNDERILKSINKINDKFLHVPIEFLLRDCGKEYRAYTIATKHLYNDEDDDKYLGHFGIGEVEYKSEIELKENAIEQLLNDIEDKFNDMKIIERYKLIKYYKLYVSIDEDAWYMLCNLSLLNEKGIEKVKQYISSLKNIDILKLNEKETEKILLLINLRDTKEENLKKELTEEKGKRDNRTYFWEQLQTKLKNDNCSNMINFARRMNGIVTMNYDDINSLIIYYSNPSYNKKEISDNIFELCLNKLYSKLSDEGIKKSKKEYYEFTYDDNYDFLFR